MEIKTVFTKWQIVFGNLLKHHYPFNVDIIFALVKIVGAQFVYLCGSSEKHVAGWEMRCMRWVGRSGFQDQVSSRSVFSVVNHRCLE